MSGVEQIEYFDVETGLQIGWEGQRETPMGVLPTTAMLRDYKKFGALMQPTTLVQSRWASSRCFAITSCEYNVVAGQRVRSCRPQIKALIK